MTVLEQHFLELVPKELMEISSQLSKLVELLHQEKEPLGNLLLDTETEAITKSSSAAKLLSNELQNLDHEELWVLVINEACIPLTKMRICVGNLTSTTLDKRRIVKACIDSTGNRVILFHNHPSGNPKPSVADIRMTEELRNCLRTFDFDLTDHIIISGKKYYSFADEETHKI